MLLSAVLIVSLALQFVAVYFALRLIRISGRGLAWSFIAAAITLMAIRRGLSLGHLFAPHAAHPPSLPIELLALAISALMAAGIERITPIIAGLRTTTERLRESEARYRLMFENSPISIWEEDFSDVKILFDRLRREGIDNLDAHFQHHPETARECAQLVRVVDVNRAALALHRADNKEQLLAGLINTFTPESFETFREELVHLWRGETAVRHDAVAKTLDGERRHVSVDFTVCPGYEQSLAKVFVSITDITERKEAETALQRRERFAQSLLRLSRRLEQAQTTGATVAAAQDEVTAMLRYQFLAVYLLNEDKTCFKVLATGGSLTDKIQEFSATLPIAGDPMLEEIAHTQDIVVVEDARTDPRTNKAIVAQMDLHTIVNVPIFLSDRHLGTISTGTFGSQPVRMPSPAEQEYLMAMASHLAVTLDRMHLLAERTAAEAALRDHKDHLEEIVEQRTEELRLARDEAEAANRAKSAFLANMSHELRTPLNAILGFSQMMSQDDDLGTTQRESLEIISHSGEHLLKLINDVLEIAKIEAGKLQLEIAPFDLHGVVRDVIDMMRLRARQKGLQLLLDQSSEFPRYIKGDEARLRQILVNIVGNAVKFTDQGGVTVRLGVRSNARQHLRIEVEDTGPGIDEADRVLLFRPFVQLSEGAARGGTGLGLSIVRQFVELMGGSVTLESAPGTGSLFRIELPLEAVDTTEIVRLSDTPHGEVTGLVPGQPAYRVLIAEDHRDNQLLLAKLMADIGLETRLANNGEECVKLFQAWRPDLIWMDRRMPGMDGVEATRHIRQLPGGDRVKIVAVTASVFKEQQPELQAAGMDDYVRKPYRFSEIYDTLARQLGVAYTYRSEAPQVPAAPVQLPPQRLAGLTAELRHTLHAALESLDRERIADAVAQIAADDAELGDALSRLTNEFDYPTVLDALHAVAGD